MTDNTTDAALLKIQQRDLTIEFFEGLGLDTTTAELMADATADQFKFNSVRLTTADGKSVLDPAVAEGYRAKYPNIFKPAAPAGADAPVPEVAPELVQAALAGSLTAKSQIALALKLDPVDRTGATVKAVEAFIHGERTKAVKPAEPGHDTRGPAKDTSADNPWSQAGWNVTKQMMLFRENPIKAAALAKAAGTSIGSTKNMKAALAPGLRRLTA